ncbi:tetratricopeptide repeat-containing sensor histidine kinase [Cesiribacter sp. SM1]|uniref:tetratricopeptide repeat-containing sensor histidine kinase n=1 Tax=Cesiribacter sp. SM1 TaxID=2861196 RepID=UPI001CD557F0|nr:tetratricopeptide repeat-containing sensor histidine kinase [Cesiribacter sp. SM1]
MSAGREIRIYRWVIFLLLFMASAAALANSASLPKGATAAHPPLSPEDSATIHQHLKDADKVSVYDQRKAIQHVNKALRLSEHHQYKKGIADAYQLKADLYVMMESSDSVRILFEQALELYMALKDPEGISSSRAGLGYWYYMRGDYAIARSYNQQALEGFKALNNSKGIAQVQNQYGLLCWSEGNLADALRYFQLATPHYKYAENNLGLIYLELAQDTLALIHFQNSLKLYESLGDEVGKGIALGNMGVAYTSLKQDSLALQYFYKSLALSEKQESLEGIAFCKKSIGLLKLGQNKLNEALVYIQEANKIYDRIGSKEGMGFCLSGIADVYLKQENYPQAISHANEGMDIARKLNSKQLISQTAKTLALAYKHEQHFEQAFKYQELFQQYSDSILNTDNIRQLEGMRYSFELQKKEIENVRLRNEKELQQARSHKQLLLILVIGGGLIVALLLLMLLLKSSIARKRSNQLLAQQKEQILMQNEELQATNEKLAELDREKDGLMSIVAHDLKSPLNRAHALAQLVRISGPLNTDQATYLQLIEKVANDGGRLIEDLLTLNQAQQISEELSHTPIVLPDWLDVLLVGYRQQAKAKNIRIEYQPLAVPVALKIDEDALTRILDNLLSNALKFSKAGKDLFISQKESPEGIRISIRDEGPGISRDDQPKLFKKFQRLSAKPTAGESSTGLGMAIVKALAEKTGTEIYVESEPGKGTQFTVLIPKNLYQHQPHQPLQKV